MNAQQPTAPTRPVRYPSGITGKRLTGSDPGSDSWKQKMTASKIAAVVGHSPHTSRFALWHEMAGTVDQPTGNTAQSRGHTLEPALAQWFADQHPNWKVHRTGSYCHPDRPWQAATPDRIIRFGTGEAPRVLELKTSSQTWEWGPSGTDEIPVYYFDQVQWQLDTLGLNTAHVAVLLGSLEIREYKIARDADYCRHLIEAATAFMATLDAGEPPSLDPFDGHLDTYRAIREMHPDIDRNHTIELTAEQAAHVRDTATALAAAEEAHRAAKATLTDLMGTARYADHNGAHVARRQANRSGSPFVVIDKAFTRGTT